MSEVSESTTTTTTSRSNRPIRPISAVFSWIAGNSSKDSAKKNEGNDGKYNRTQAGSSFVPLWRQTSIAFSIPDWWWEQLNIHDLTVWNDKEMASSLAAANLDIVAVSSTFDIIRMYLNNSI